MDDTHQANNPSHSKISLPTIPRSIPGEIAALPASTRTSFTRVDHGTRPGTAAGDNYNHPDEAVPDDGGADAGAPQPEDVQQLQEETGAPAAVPQVPQTLVQFLLVSGRRRSMAFDPETTVGRVKELLWNTWPNGTSTSSPPPPPPFPNLLSPGRLRPMVPEGAVPHGTPTRPDPVHFLRLLIVVGILPILVFE